MTTEVLKNDRSEFDKFIDEMKQTFEKYDKYLAIVRKQRHELTTEVLYVALIHFNPMSVKLII